MSRTNADRGSEIAPGRAHPGLFATTHWSVVVAAGRDNPDAQAQALEKLCQTYWYPLYAYIRRRGYGPEDAQDLAQEFFARLLQKNYPAQADRAKGKFRSFLLLTLNHFLADQYDRATTRKRGGGQVLIRLDQHAAEERYSHELSADLSPEKLFERRWAQNILEQALARLRAEYAAEDPPETCAVLQLFEPGEQLSLSYAQAAARLGISETALKSKIHRLRQRHRELVRAEIAQTVCTASETDEELRHLMTVLSG